MILHQSMQLYESIWSGYFIRTSWSWLPVKTSAVEKKCQTHSNGHEESVEHFCCLLNSILVVRDRDKESLSVKYGQRIVWTALSAD